MISVSDEQFCSARHEIKFTSICRNRGLCPTTYSILLKIVNPAARIGLITIALTIRHAIRISTNSVVSLHYENFRLLSLINYANNRSGNSITVHNNCAANSNRWRDCIIRIFHDTVYQISVRHYCLSSNRLQKYYISDLVESQ